MVGSRTRVLFAVVLAAALMDCKPKTGDIGDADTDGGSSVSTAAAVDAAPPPPPMPEQLLEDHRREMAEAAEAGHYADVCTGTPWFNKSICTWVAARADGKSVDRPDSGTFRGIYYSEHWNHVYGSLLDDHADQDGRYEVTAGGYKNHCLLVTADTKYTTKGAWNLWVQEQPEAEEVTTNSGAKVHWVVLEEMPLAKALMDLSHSGVSVESTANAKDAMVMIANYKPYTERKGQLPTLPSTSATPATASVPVVPSSASTPMATSGGTAPTANQPTKKAVASIREDVPQVTGGLAMAAVQKVVHDNLGSARACYENGLSGNPTLAGRVSIKFIIDRTGAVSTAQDQGSNLSDSNVVQCIVRAFGGLSFPAPEGGIVTVVYPLVLTSG